MLKKDYTAKLLNSDVMKPDRYHFEALGTVRDGSKSTTKNATFVMDRGYDGNKIFQKL